MHTKILRRSLTLFFIVALSLSNTSCFLQTISGATFQIGSDLITTVQTDSILATCVNGGFGSANVECTYFFFDESGFPVETSSSAQLISEFGLLGVVIDPLIYQIPENATNITGTYEDETGNTGALVIQSGYRSIPMDISRTLIAEPGTVFVIAELPDAVPFEGLTFTFSLSFTQLNTGIASVPVKPMLALKYGTADQVFYPPMLPCVHDMADVPGYVISPAPIQPIAINGTPAGCSDEVYPLLGFGVFACDFDSDDDVDADDIAVFSRVRNSPALPGDRLDNNSDGFIDLNDARRCALTCLQPNCAIGAPKDDVPIDSITFGQPVGTVKP